MSTLPVFATPPKGRPELDLDRLAIDILGGRDLTSTTRGGATQVRGADVMIDVDAGRGGVWAGDLGRLWRAEPVDTPDAEAVAEIAQSTLDRTRMVPEFGERFRMTRGKVRYGQLLTEDDGGRSSRRGEAVFSQEVELDVSDRDDLKAKTLPMFGGGGRFTTTVGDGGQVVGVAGVWRGAESVDERPLLEVDEALERAGIGTSPGVKVTSAELGYYAAPAFAAQDLLFPVYAVRGEVHDGKETVPTRVRLVPATDVGEVSPPERPQPDRRDKRDLLAELSARLEPGLALPAGLSVSTTALAAKNVSPERVLTRTPSGQVFLKPQLSPELIQILLEALRPRAFGTSWIGTWGGLGGSQANAQGFVDELTAEGWQRRFNWGNQAAFKSDWVSNDDTYVDDVDFVFYTGHASPNGWQLATAGSADWLHHSDVGASPNVPSDHWGQENLEWMAIAACGPLEDDIINGGGNVFDRWRGAFDGLHLLLGYAAVTYDNTEEGRRLASYARSGMTLVQAWFRTGQEIQPSTNGYGDPYGPDVYAAAMYIGNASGNTAGDHLWGHGSVGPDIRNSTYRGCMFSPC
ncbi:DUF6345 domain-containing protein [Ornithinimicrobium sp. F0845]|uniref:DUF6345 domain-containing protein n=1 Tax=Ornithinimicrobium sp. F0845 TaxID=2926412 RepID=UPI001FF3B34B|nr:DUF6345 domain-containing protein [Ornithinimicrobium sp. F0845]MCK0111972.1 DUF6345 domain-containing protein [Ornithinimicrobium sp. F0845]